MSNNNIVNIEYNRVTNVTSTDFPSYSQSNSGMTVWETEKFKNTLDIEIKSLEERDCNFDLKNVDTSIANAFRRIMISEVPSVAAEAVYIYNNTSVLQDEVLAHRIGLVPLQIDPEELIWCESNGDNDENTESKYTDKNTIVLTLDIACTRNVNAPKGCTDPKILYHNSSVYSRDLKFQPEGNQAEIFANKPIVPCDDDILICKLRPGQEISLRVHCILGVGADHAKFSPVSTASYRLLPHINLMKDFTGESAKRLQGCFPEGVIGIDADGKAFVKDARKDTVSREVLRYDEFKNDVKLGRIRDHFIFNVESTGAMTPEEIFFKSVRILKSKAEYLKNCPISQ